jgi:hypothetical protein
VGVCGTDQMSETEGGLPVYMDRAMAAVRQVPAALQPLSDDPVTTAGLLRGALTDPTRRRAALLLASLLDPIVTMLTLDIMVDLAASDRDAILVRQILGRLPHHEVLARVPAVVDVLLDEADDRPISAGIRRCERITAASARRTRCPPGRRARSTPRRPARRPPAWPRPRAARRPPEPGLRRRAAARPDAPGS